MKIWYIEEDGEVDFNETRGNPIIVEKVATKAWKIKEPITITLHIEIDKERYQRIKQKFKTTLSDRIFSYFGF